MKEKITNNKNTFINKSESLCDFKTHKKSATDNEWTSNNTKYYPDKREEKDGPGGN